MPAEVKILVEGVTNEDSTYGTGEEHTQPTITLVRDGDTVMVIDPGILEDQKILIDALKKEDLTVNDVDIVCITHSHLDHYRNLGMFPTAKALDYYGLWDKTTTTIWAENFTPNIRIIHTPGHDYTGITFLVTTAEGVVAICGDVFWKENYPLDPHNDAHASNPEKLRESRAMILKAADFVVPGHAGIYKNIKATVYTPEEQAYEVKKKELKIAVACKICGNPMKQRDKCACRPYLCFKCCECGLDCNLCSCSHKK